MDRDKLIVSKKVVANKAAKSYINQFPELGHLKSDLQSAAMLGVVKAVDHLLTQGKAIDDAYLMVAAQRAILTTVDELGDTLRVPRSSKKLAAKNGVKIDQTFVGSLPADYDCVDDRGGPSLMCQVNDACRTDTERTIVSMLSQGYTQRQIATHLQSDPRRISEQFQKIKQRVRNGEDGIDEEYIPVPKSPNGKCRCGKPPARWNYGNDDRCEDCYADDSFRFHGRSQRVKVLA